MMAPRTRLLLMTAIVAIPLITLAGMGLSVSPMALVTVLALALLVLGDALMTQGRARQYGADLPDVIRMTKDRESTIPIRLAQAEGGGRLRVGLRFPAVFEVDSDAREVQLPEGETMSTITWACTPLRRGNYVLDTVYVETSSPLGFWASRAEVSTRCEIRVYPNLREERRDLAALFLHRGSFGLHVQRQIGKGREFDQLRDYIPGDSFDDIHWKATARRGQPITKVYRIERTQEIYVVIDASRLSARRPPERTQTAAGHTSHLERFLTAALVLGLAAEKQGDHFGVAVFDDRVRQFVRAGSGTAHYGICRDAIYRTEPRLVNPDYRELASFLRQRLRRRALLIVLTNLDDPVLSEDYTRAAELLGRRHLVLTGMMTPPQARPLFHDTDVETPEDIYRDLAGHFQWHDLRELERVLHRHGVTFTLIENERLCVELVSRYINIKQRQLL